MLGLSLAGLAFFRKKKAT
ncbi:hypothetical protein EXY25_15850 [Corallincola spongiicola]|uniref:Uncharacterized protein n=1 Tax=Corallincola spongiicola TaxID=2520508 RepID=A0ABY1WM50_9GAMM|nr:hypothetical protein EXY25_15850 [Corallincola spongiicola]